MPTFESTVVQILCIGTTKWKVDSAWHTIHKATEEEVDEMLTLSIVQLLEVAYEFPELLKLKDASTFRKEP